MAVRTLLLGRSVPRVVGTATRMSGRRGLASAVSDDDVKAPSTFSPDKMKQGEDL